MIKQGRDVIVESGNLVNDDEDWIKRSPPWVLKAEGYTPSVSSDRDKMFGLSCKNPCGCSSAACDFLLAADRIKAIATIMRLCRGAARIVFITPDALGSPLANSRCLFLAKTSTMLYPNRLPA